jgi:hypothetical protein
MSKCDSKGIVYIIFCSKCSIFYIGESSRTVSIRLNEHIKNIQRFRDNLEKYIATLSSTSETAIHFNRKGHSLNDFRFAVFDINLDDEKRWSTETDLINLFKTLKIPILNVKINAISSIKHLTFTSS